MNPKSSSWTSWWPLTWSISMPHPEKGVCSAYRPHVISRQGQSNPATKIIKIGTEEKDQADEIRRDQCSAQIAHDKFRFSSRPRQLALRGEDERQGGWRLNQDVKHERESGEHLEDG